MPITDANDNETEAQTRRVVINALSQPGSLFPSGIKVIFDGEEVSERVLDIAATYVAFDRQDAKRGGRKFDAVASLTRHIPAGFKAIEREEELFRKKGIGAAVSSGRGSGYTENDLRAAISPRHPMKAPLVLSSEGVGA
ncbi:hypothetical protein EBE87_25880 [Pseudoroseomonas wenyumeiae]|uniref:OmpA-like domain-containing protein n=1 Tax=Teichococcus wenyumeiae TaxID=2478470 RepID=A0A3A9JF56_9PROT|nr:hypothetical protein [Pseudoroseomonas wenyumeiae]RKK03323.1 hypothetical protein D6Z83_15300 [Pseudoroseomonas wenyumeiae]RMI15409.1 hypothetical protein EBE87_25880 [Pseudoroseomonas wenyumeiae]